MTNEAEIKFIDTIRHQYFDGVTEEAAEVANGITENGINLHSNCDLEAFPEGYELAIQPVGTRGKGNHAVAAVAIPTLETILESEVGATWIRGQIRTLLTKRTANPLRDWREGAEMPVLPFDLSDFIETKRAVKVDTKAFTALAKHFVAMLKDRGLKTINNAILRQVLQSSAFATSQYASVKQEFWAGVLGMMIEAAEKNNLDSTQMKNWLATRDSVVMEEVEELDLSALDGLSIDI